MIDNNEKIKKKIEKIKQKLNTWEDRYLIEPDNIKDLRRVVMYVHTVIEREILNSEIGLYLIDKLKKETTTSREIHYFYIDLSVILDDMDFVKKIKVAQKYQLFSKKLIKKFLIVNQLRVYCSHPTSHMDKLENFMREKSYLEALVQVEDTLNSIDAFMKNKYKK